MPQLSPILDRRSFLAVAAAGLVGLPRLAFGQLSRVKLVGELKQGALIIGKTEPGATIDLDGKRLRVAPEGTFGFGFPYDQKTPSRITVRFAGGSAETSDLNPAIRQYEIQRISGLPEDFVTPPADTLQRIKRETATIDDARRRDTDVSWFAGGFDWPLPGIVSSLYGSQRILNGQPRAPHLAVDIAAPAGTPIHAPADGIVSLVSDYYFDGAFTILDHGHGISTCYAHQSKQLVTPGDRISRGQVIGEVGQSGRTTGPNLHWGMNWFEVSLDPSLSTPTPMPTKS